MKKITLLALLLAFSWQVRAQTLENRHELKLDVAYLIAGFAKVEYEYWLNEWSTVGTSAFYNFAGGQSDYNVQMLGTYRLFFGKQPRTGFFLEGNLGVISGEYEQEHYNSGIWKQEHKPYTAFGMGLALGWKYHIPKSGVTLDLFFGVGRMVGNNDLEFYPRAGVSIGKRF